MERSQSMDTEEIERYVYGIDQDVLRLYTNKPLALLDSEKQLLATAIERLTEILNWGSK